MVIEINRQDVSFGRPIPDGALGSTDTEYKKELELTIVPFPEFMGYIIKFTMEEDNAVPGTPTANPVLQS